jgi:hypothetical protein
MIEIIWQHDPDNPVVEHQPGTAAQAAALLNEGNAALGRSADPR